MDKPGFRNYLQEHQIAEEEIEQHLVIVERFEQFLSQSGAQYPSENATAEDIRAFSVQLIQDNQNTVPNYYGLVHYARFVKNDAMVIALIELLDGSEALDNLYQKLAEAVGDEKRDRVFQGIDLPPLGTPLSERPHITQVVMERLEQIIDPAVVDRILSSCLRDLQDEWYLDGKRKYLESEGIEAYLEQKGKAFIAQLEQIRDEGGLFFTQPITDAVVDFVRSRPDIAQGVLRGNILYETKIPYMTVEYLNETDPVMRRYYYCHCPWVREAIKTNDVAVSAKFCNCSAGFHKKSWDVIFDQPLKATVVESVLQGDEQCRFAIHLPKSVDQTK